MKAVHPRIRGERRYRIIRGSRWTRFIPAYAGNAYRRRYPTKIHAVHPRIRGERPTLAARALYCSGSSPHTRGTRRFTMILATGQRFIPAYAGNASLSTNSVLAVTVHPRIRGDRKRPTELLRTVLGSSPHTRGTPHTSSENSLNRRFIPAYAGNAGEGKINATLMAVHPRIRGERNGFTV